MAENQEKLTLNDLIITDPGDQRHHEEGVTQDIIISASPDASHQPTSEELNNLSAELNDKIKEIIDATYRRSINLGTLSSPKVTTLKDDKIIVTVTGLADNVEKFINDFSAGVIKKPVATQKEQKTEEINSSAEVDNAPSPDKVKIKALNEKFRREEFVTKSKSIVTAIGRTFAPYHFIEQNATAAALAAKQSVDAFSLANEHRHLAKVIKVEIENLKSQDAAIAYQKDMAIAMDPENPDNANIKPQLEKYQELREAYQNRLEIEKTVQLNKATPVENKLYQELSNKTDKEIALAASKNIKALGDKISSLDTKAQKLVEANYIANHYTPAEGSDAKSVEAIIKGYQKNVDNLSGNINKEYNKAFDVSSDKSLLSAAKINAESGEVASSAVKTISSKDVDFKDVNSVMSKVNYIGEETDTIFLKPVPGSLGSSTKDVFDRISFQHQVSNVKDAIDSEIREYTFEVNQAKSALPRIDSVLDRLDAEIKAIESNPIAATKPGAAHLLDPFIDYLNSIKPILPPDQQVAADLLLDKLATEDAQNGLGNILKALNIFRDLAKSHPEIYDKIGPRGAVEAFIEQKEAKVTYLEEQKELLDSYLGAGKVNDKILFGLENEIRISLDPRFFKNDGNPFDGIDNSEGYSPAVAKIFKDIVIPAQQAVNRNNDFAILDSLNKISQSTGSNNINLASKLIEIANREALYTADVGNAKSNTANIAAKLETKVTNALDKQENFITSVREYNEAVATKNSMLKNIANELFGGNMQAAEAKATETGLLKYLDDKIISTGRGVISDYNSMQVNNNEIGITLAKNIDEPGFDDLLNQAAKETYTSVTYDSSGRLIVTDGTAGQNGYAKAQVLNRFAIGENAKVANDPLYDPYTNINKLVGLPPAVETTPDNIVIRGVEVVNFGGEKYNTVGTTVIDPEYYRELKEALDFEQSQYDNLLRTSGPGGGEQVEKSQQVLNELKTLYIEKKSQFDAYNNMKMATGNPSLSPAEAKQNALASLDKQFKDGTIDEKTYANWKNMFEGASSKAAAEANPASGSDVSDTTAHNDVPSADNITLDSDITVSDINKIASETIQAGITDSAQYEALASQMAEHAALATEIEKTTDFIPNFTTLLAAPPIGIAILVGRMGGSMTAGQLWKNRDHKIEAKLEVGEKYDPTKTIEENVINLTRRERKNLISLLEKQLEKKEGKIPDTEKVQTLVLERMFNKFDVDHNKLKEKDGVYGKELIAEMKVKMSKGTKFLGFAGDKEKSVARNAGEYVKNVGKGLWKIAVTSPKMFLTNREKFFENYHDLSVDDKTVIPAAAHSTRRAAIPMAAVLAVAAVASSPLTFGTSLAVAAIAMGGIGALAHGIKYKGDNYIKKEGKHLTEQEKESRETHLSRWERHRIFGAHQKPELGK